MKTNLWKRAAALLLALVLCFACVGTASAAEDVSGKVYLISYPRDGDENYHTGSWGHDALYFRHGWKLSASDYLDVRAIGSYDANICYCIEPGVIQNTGDAFSRMGEDFWENMPDFNDLMTPQQIKRYIGRIMTYGYTGGVSTQWRSQNAGGEKLAQAYATQLLIWETVVGERDADFRYVAPTDADAVREVIRDTHPLREKIFAHYDSIVSNVQKHTKVPSFCAKTLREARTVTLEWNGNAYSTVLTDENGVLENYTFSADDPDVQCTIAGNRLILTMENAPKQAVTLTAEKKNSARCGVITWTDGQFGIGSGLQDLVTYAETVNDPVEGFLLLTVPNGNLKLKKTSEDGVVGGIQFNIKGDNFNKTVTTDKDGNITVEGLFPATYTITEQSIDRYEPQKSQTVTLIGGKTTTVNFNNTLKRGSLEVIKNSEDNLVEGVKFHLYGTSLSGLPVDEYAVTDAKGVAKFSDVLISGDTPYVVEEVDTAIRYVVPASQTAPIEWEKVTSRTFVNVLKKFNVTVTKSDVETGTEQGDASLAGAVYGIYKGEELIDTYATDNNGQFTTEYYVCGDDWTIREISPSEGYLLDPTIHKVGAEPQLYTVEHNQTANDVTEQVVKGNIAIIKHTDNVRL